MVGNILKVIATFIGGYLAGMLLGGVLGVLLGLLPGLFFSVIAEFSILISILLMAILGGLLGYIEVRIFNKMFDADDRPWLGVVFGAIFGLIFGILGYGVLDAAGSEAFSQYYSPVSLIYSGAVGSRIGEVIFSVFATVQMIRELVRASKVRSLPVR
jgi:ABC-type Co2+ transport system permease subunit